MFNPVSTYRIQFHKGFNFKDLMTVLPYLHGLGISTIYASPVFEAVPGSNHGYDVINPHRINPEIGTLAEFEELGGRLKKLGMYWLQDIVPNHMAFDPHNAWLMDVLEKGKKSEYAQFFDIIWENPAFDGKLMAPFLGHPLSEVIAARELTVVHIDDKFKFKYTGQLYPLNSASIFQIFDNGGEQPTTLQRILSAVSKDKTQDLQEALSGLPKTEKEQLSKYFRKVLDKINNSESLLSAIAEAQYYRLSFWKDSNSQINYRRFFTVNGLICLNIQHEGVFNEYHRFLKTLLDKGHIQGLRIDHIDGLFDPATYLERLRKLAGPDCYIIAEKILEEGEDFPATWPVQGSTGYEFLGTVNNLFSEIRNKQAFTEFYQQLTGNRQRIGKAISEKKSDILYGHMAGELENLYQMFCNLDLAQAEQFESILPQTWKETIAGFLICCPVYRYYANSLPLEADEAEAVKAIFRQVLKARPDLELSATYLEALFTGSDEKDQAGILRFYQRCMQFTGPLMAKGVEDTLMYTYERFAGHNEVGDSPAAFGLQIKHFHNRMIQRQARWPMSMNGTSSHDTKRGEDVRARLNVLSDIPGQWFDQVKSWIKENHHLKTDNAPDINDEYLIYQTLTGFTPLPGQPDDETEERLIAYLTKALREAKTHTEWAEPDEKYEQATLQFAKELLKTPSFLKSMKGLQNSVSEGFMTNSLVQVLLKFCCPGMPDIYQGCELWDFSLVDPDNRRPVDYKLRSGLLRKVKQFDAGTVWNQRHNGSAKMWLTHKLLLERKNDPKFFSDGDYIPLQVEGKHRERVIAFARRYQRQWLVVMATLHPAAVNLHAEWADTALLLPDDAPLQWTEVLSGNDLILDKSIRLSAVLKEFPVLLLRSAKTAEKRSAGVILHVTSLPSAYGIGDMGPEARNFAGFLSDSHQRYWQLLPVTPTSAEVHYSPYSSFSSVAGNTMLISPDDLITDGLLTQEETSKYKQPAKGPLSYAKALTIKNKLFATAYQRFLETCPDDLAAGFESFKKNEKYWLEDFALYEVIKARQKGRPWYHWPETFKSRDTKTLSIFKEKNRHDIDKSMWLQYIFLRQWLAMKKFVHENGLRFIGDIPFYVSYDAADVWTRPELFALDEDKNPAYVAGVPPDYFNPNGQLWNMPVYNWREHQATGYGWWVNRMKKNSTYYDLIRLDHFRGFYDFWEVPAVKKNAMHGSWQKGPGADFFEVLKKELGDMPFIAEDLGDISPGVYELRDKFELPGMNVLQYAFGEDMPVSVHALHNHVPNSITYTGTHDNNTLIGWYKKELTDTARQNLKASFRVKVTQRNIKNLLLETCYSSVSAVAMAPLQDILGLDERARMNIPGKKNRNWTWRLNPDLLTEKLAASLRQLVKRYNR